MQPGDQLANGRYTLERQITRSGMAEVWIARQQVGGGMSKSVVIKMIHPDLNAQQEARQRFFDEARFMSQIHHANVVQFYDFGEDEEDDLLFQVMEFIEGFAIEQIVARSRELGQSIPIPIVCRLIADACKGLGYIHDLCDDRGVNMELVHRDISPQNLLISKSGSIKIIDFGIIKARDKSSRTRTGVIVGKLQYMSPEQLSSEDLDRRSDIYSLGLVLYEMLTLEPRFRGSNLLEVFYEALNEPPPPVVDLRPDCPPAIVQCIQTALAQEKDHRFATAYHMQELIESYLHQQGAPVSDWQIADYLNQLFQDGDVLTEQTTQIHAASLLGADFFKKDMSEVESESRPEATVTAWADDVLSGASLSGPRGAAYPPSGERTPFANIPQHSYSDDIDGHTLGGFAASQPLSDDIDGHTLAPISSSSSTPMPYSSRDHLAPRRGIDSQNEEPTILNTTLPAGLGFVPPTPPPPASGSGNFMAPPPPPPLHSSPATGEQSVLISPSLFEEGDNLVTAQEGNAAHAFVSKTIEQDAQSISKRMQEQPSRSKAAASQKGALSSSHGYWIIIGLLIVFIILIIVLLIRLM